MSNGAGRGTSALIVVNCRLGTSMPTGTGEWGRLTDGRIGRYGVSRVVAEAIATFGCLDVVISNIGDAGGLPAAARMGTVHRFVT